MEAQERTLALLRRQRHDFMNHLQVISGWLQLGRPDRAQQYLTDVSERLTAESGLVRNLAPALALAVVELGLEAATHGVAVNWQLGGDVVPPDFREAVLQAIERCSRLPEDERRLRVDLWPDGRFTVHTSTEQGEG